MSEPLPVDGFEWMKNLSKIDEDFIKNYDEKTYMICIVIYHSYQKE